MPLTRLFAGLRAVLRRISGRSDVPLEGASESSGRPELWVCPNDQEVREVTTIGLEGGTLEIGDHRLEVPPGAVTEAVEFSGELLVDRLLKVRLQANGADSLAFSEPASLILSYAKCEGPGQARPSHVFKIDPRSNAVLRQLRGRVNQGDRTVTVNLESLSTYTLGVSI